MAREIKVTRDNFLEIREELQWHLRGLTLDLEQHYVKHFVPKKK